MFFINHTEIGEGSAVIIEIEGSLNSESSPDFDDYTWKLVENDIIFILMDMEKLGFISSEGIGAILLIQKNIHDKNGLVVFYNLNHEITSLFKLLGFDKVFTIAEDRADALQILDRHMELHPSREIVHKHDPALIATSGTGGITEEISEFIEEENGFEDIIEEPPAAADLEKGQGKFEPFVIECIKCKSLIRVNEQGEQMCPSCNTEFTVSDENKAEFTLTENPL